MSGQANSLACFAVSMNPGPSWSSHARAVTDDDHRLCDHSDLSHLVNVFVLLARKGRDTSVEVLSMAEVVTIRWQSGGTRAQQPITRRVEFVMHIIFIFPVQCKWTSISQRSDTGGWILPISALPRELSCLGSLKLARRFCKIDDILMRYLHNNTSKSCPFRIRPMNFDGVVGVRFQVPATARRGSGKEEGEGRKTGKVHQKAASKENTKTRTDQKSVFNSGKCHLVPLEAPERHAEFSLREGHDTADINVGCRELQRRGRVQPRTFGLT
ncbi:hypothetical protein LY78DRAFT_662708 [Colletotrichum sublineola]|nr:hypothetical protein LY78DRAFT_662708 [Colletotrichum sublineola]